VMVRRWGGGDGGGSWQRSRHEVVTRRWGGGDGGGDVAAEPRRGGGGGSWP
jgi:hypothetical protein